MRFNVKQRERSVHLNHEGDIAFVMSSQMELYTTVLTTALEDNTYEKQEERFERIVGLVGQCDPLFVAKLAIYARTRMNLRSVPLLLVCALARTTNGSDLVSRVIERVVLRADEIAELLACYAMFNERREAKQLGRLSKQVQKGLSAAFNRFDEYQFAKYDRPGAVKLRDALFLVHPKAKDTAQQTLFDKIATQNLEVPSTWEVKISSVGQRPFASDAGREAAMKEAWESLIDQGDLGYMALLRNVRNIVRANVSDDRIDRICVVLSDPERVRNSKQLPFRFLSAYRELQAMLPDPDTMLGQFGRWLLGKNDPVAKITRALEKAVIESAASIKGFSADTRVLIACDVSGSMWTPVSAKSSVRNYDVGLMLGMLLYARCGRAEIGMFGDIWKIISVPKQNILENVLLFDKREGEVGYSTNGYLVIHDLLQRNVVMDKVMLFTDCQLWNSNNNGNHIESLWKQYRYQCAPNAKLYLFDLAGYGQAPLQLRSDGVHLIAGWSDKIFDVLAAIDEGGVALDAVHQIDFN